MSVSKERASSALSVSSNEIDRQLDDLAAKNNTSSSNQQRDCPDKTDEDGERASENVAVMVRCRPLAASEQKGSLGNGGFIRVDEPNKSVEVAGERQFYFDQVFSEQSNNERVYMRSARRLVDAAFAGFNCTIFLYGQTGTGKTYTHSSLTQSAFEHLFSLIQDADKKTRFLIRVSYYELYNEEIRDLLVARSVKNQAQKGGLELRESKERGVYVKDLTNFLVSNLSELIKLKQMGDKRRTTAATQMNEHSSRSHSILSITIETTSDSQQSDPSGGDGARRKSMQGAEHRSGNGAVATASASTANKKRSAGKRQQQQQQSLRMGRLHLIDLAGSERQSKSGSSGQQLKEASRINLSLTCLSLVIRALTDQTNLRVEPKHVPYRNSKLTRLLSSSLGGNSKTLLIACISPARTSLDETLNTLRFASRTKQIKNRAVINEDPKDALLRKYRRQLEELRAKLNERQQREKRDQLVNQPDGAGLIERKSSKSDYLDSEENEQQEQLVKRLEVLRAKIMFGGENLLDKVELHERLLTASRQELEERQFEEAKLRKELANKRQTIEQVSKSKGSLEGQRVHLDESLHRAMLLYKQSKLELRDLASEHEQFKEQLVQTIKSTSKEIKYVDCILDDFIPREYLDMINAYAKYDEESDEWQIKYIALSGNNMAAQTRRFGMTVDVNMSTLGRSEQTEKFERYERGDERRRRRDGRKSTSARAQRSDPFLRLS